MKAFFAVFTKEIKSYIDHPLAYILAIVFLVINHALFFNAAFLEQVLSLRSLFNFLPWVLLFFVPALTMRSWAEERKEQTLAQLLSYPVSVWVVVAGKFAASAAFVSALLLSTLTIPFALSVAGDLDGGVVAAQYLGAILLATAMVAVGQWASTLSKNQVVAFIISLAVLFGFYLISLDFVLLSLPYPLNIVGQQLGMLSHVQSLSRGLIDARDVVYFLSVIVVFGALSVAWLLRLKTAVTDPMWKKIQSTVALVIAIAVVINLFGQSLTIRFDATEGNVYSLSSATKTILGDLDDTVRITLYRSKKLPTQVELISRDISDMLNDYAKYGGRHIQVSVKYPDQDEDAQAEAAERGIQRVRFNVLRQDEFTVQEGYIGLIIEFLDKREILPLVQNTDDLEYRLSRAILTLIDAKKPKVGYISDFGGKSLESYGSFAEQLRENYLIEQISLSSAEEGAEVDQIDESIDVLIIAGPTTKLTDAALDEIRGYIGRGGRILWLLPGVNVNQANLNATPTDTGLESILAASGVQLQKDLVADLSSHETVNFRAGMVSYFFPYPYWLRAVTGRHVLVGNIQQLIMPWPSSLVLDQNASTITPLVRTSEQAAHFTSNFRLSPDSLPDFSGAELSTRVLAAAVESIPAEEGHSDGRWVIVANTEFLDNSIVDQYPQNIPFALNAIDWLSQNDALVSIRSKQSQPPAMIFASKRQQSLVKYGNVIGMPVLVAIGGAAWLYRRRRYIQSV